MRGRRSVSLLGATVLLAGAAVLAGSPGAAGAAGSQAASPPTAKATVTTRMVPGGQVTHLGRGTGSSGGELAPAFGPEASTAKAPVANRSLSSRARATRTGPGLSGIPATSTPITTGAAAVSFEAINHHQQRFEVAGGNQWSLEPPDQGLCVGNGYVFEAVNNAVAVYSTSGSRLALRSLNEFFRYPVEIDRTKGIAGPKQTTDPTCLFDPTTQRFFLTILTYDADAAGNPLPSGHNTLDTAVSASADPTGAWTITHIDATDDGTGGTPAHPSCPCLGDYPHIGVDATGFYISTNEYPWATDGFVGAQIYAMSKAQLASGATSVRVTQVDTSRAAPGDQPGFTVWPAQSPSTAQYSAEAGGTEYFLSTNAAEEANGSGRSSQLLTWSLTNTSSLATGSTPDLGVNVVSSQVGEYAVPLPAQQKAGSVPLADCLNLTACSKAVWGTPDRFKEVEGPVDPLDSRMQQVAYANGMLYGAHGTAVDVGSPLVQRAGVAWYVTEPITATNGNLSTSVLHQGRLASADNNVMFPAMGVRDDGSAVMALSVAGVDHFPSAAYADLSTTGSIASVNVVAEGVGPQDGFTEYRIAQTRPRFGDYGAAAVDGTGHVWVANEWIGQTCTFSQYLAAPLGQCGGTRTALANWSTRISQVAHP